PDRHADAVHSMAGGRLAQPVLPAHAPGRGARARRPSEAARATGHDVAGTGAAFHPPSSGRDDRDPGDAKAGPREGELRRERWPPARHGPHRSVARAPLGEGLGGGVATEGRRGGTERAAAQTRRPRDFCGTLRRSWRSCTATPPLLPPATTTSTGWPLRPPRSST